MSSSKHIDIICVVAVVLALIITVLFMNGEKLGITPIKNGDEESGEFTANDINAEWDTSAATKITLNGSGGSVEGDGAYVLDGSVHIAYAGKYVLSGELTDGSVIIEANENDKIWILLNGISLNCENSAAIFVRRAGKVFLTLASGTENSISTGAEYSDEADSMGIDGAIYSKDDLTINGGGSLVVNAEYKHGIVCNDDLVIVGAKIDITAAQDGIHANDSARFAEVDLTIRAGDDGVTVSNDDETAYVYVESGNITITDCYEGIEAIDITIAGGVLNITSTDDGINANGRGSNSVIRIMGGDITILNPTGRDADGLDSNGDIYISGGKTFISVSGNSTNCAIDYGSENGGVCEMNGGTVIAAGGSTMLEAPASSSQQGFIMYNSSNAPAKTEVVLKSSDGEILLEEAIPYSFTSVILSTPELKIGDTCTLLIGDTQTEITVDNAADSKGFAGTFGGKPQDGNFGDPEGGGFSGGQMPNGEMPGDEMPNGEMPSGGFDGPQGGGFNGGQMPNGEMPSDEMPNGEMPSGGFGGPQGGGFGGGQMPNGDHGNESDKPQWEENNRNQNDMQDKPTGISPSTLILTAISALLLLAGILIAIKVKH